MGFTWENIVGDRGPELEREEMNRQILPQAMPCGTLTFWQEPHGCWSARISVKLPEIPDWTEAATGFEEADEAIAWGRQRTDLALAND